MIPTTISCCYSFILPAGTPCNAMVLTAGRMKSADMVHTFDFLTDSSNNLKRDLT